jgi:hypothetical protein
MYSVHTPLQKGGPGNFTHAELPAMFFRVQHTLHPEYINSFPFLSLGGGQWIPTFLLQCKRTFCKVVMEYKLLK